MGGGGRERERKIERQSDRQKWGGEREGKVWGGGDLGKGSRVGSSAMTPSCPAVARVPEVWSVCSGGRPLSIELGTRKAIMARLWPWLSGTWP